jgi:ABC-type transport system substrate-binding protein
MTKLRLLFFALILAVVAIACDATTQDQIDQAVDQVEALATDANINVTAVVEQVEAAATQVSEVVAADPTAEPEMVEEPAETMEFVALDPLVDESCSGAFSSIEATGQYEVAFNLCNPDPAFLSKIAFTAFSIFPEEYLNETGGTGAILEAPVGTGPYKVDVWNRGDSIIFSKNEDYWGDPAISDQLVFRWASEGAARLLELQSGQVDGIDNPSPDDFETIASDDSLQLIERPALNIFYFGMTNTFPPFDNVQVRQAVAMGIDRQRIVDNFYPGGSEVASHFTPCSIPNGCEGEAWYDFDPEAARQLLADAGFPDGFETTIYYRDVFRSYLPEPGLVAQELQAQLENNLGITAQIEVMESGAFIAESSAGNLNGFHLLGWGADYPHPTNFLDFHFGQANGQFGTPHPEIYEVLAEAASVADPAEAAPLYEQANNMIKELVPMVPIAHGGSAVAYRAEVEGGFASPLGNEYFAVMNSGRDQFVWMQNAEPISLFCADETDGESLRACEQVQEALYSYEIGGTAAVPALATNCEPNADLTAYVCTLREGVTFHDGTTFDANDVIATFSANLDVENPNHAGNTGVYEYYDYLWGLINKPPSE